MRWIVVAAMLFGCGPSAPPYQAAVSKSFFDPEAAQFRDVVQHPDGVVCGTVNGKNRMGGYVGFVRFALVPGKSVLFDPQVTVTAKDEIADLLECYGGPNKIEAACDRAAAKHRLLQDQAAFDAVWDARCKP